MGEESLKSSQDRLRIMVETHLVEHATAIIIDAFTHELTLFVERVESA